MQKSLLFVSLFALCLALPNMADARMRGYFTVRGGLSDVRETTYLDTNEAVFVPSGAVGLYNGPLRAEVEYAYLSSGDFEKTDSDKPILKTKFSRVMGNGYIDLKVSPYIQPYIGAGAGVVHYNVEHDEFKKTGSNFAWSAGGGVGFRLTRNLTADAGIRYIDLGKVELKEGAEELSFDTVETYAGLRFLF